MIISSWEPVTKAGYSGLSKQYNVAYIAEGFDYDIYKRDFDNILSSLKSTLSQDQIVALYEKVRLALEKDRQAYKQFVQNEKRQELEQELKKQHNNKVMEELNQGKKCPSVLKEINDRLMKLKNATGVEKDDLQMTLNYFQGEYSKECKATYKPTTNLTMVTIPRIENSHPKSNHRVTHLLYCPSQYSSLHSKKS